MGVFEGPPRKGPIEPEDIGNPDEGYEGTELDEMSASDSQGAPPANVVVDGASMSEASSDISDATDSLLTTALNGQAGLQGNANYGVIPKFKSVGYELPGDPFGDRAHYQPMPPEVVAAVHAKNPNYVSLHNEHVLQHFIEADQAFSDASWTYERAKRIKRDLPALREARDEARRLADGAQTSATLADGLAQRPVDKKLAKLAQDAAYDASDFARHLDNAVKEAERTTKVWEDANGKVAVKRVLSAALPSLAMTIGGALIWAFVFGGGRKVAGSGQLRFGVKPITKDLPDNQTTADIDVLKENGDLILVQAVHLHDGQGQQVDTFAGFTAKDNHITYQMPNPKVASASVNYVLEAQSAPAMFTDPELLTINFTPVAVDIIEPAVDRTKPVSFAVPAGAILIGSTIEQLGWVADKTAVTYTPVDPEGPTREITYQVTNGTQAKLIALFPAQDLAPLDGSRSADTVFPLPAGSAPVKLLDAQAAQQTSVKVTGGTWKVDDRQITFTPDSALSTAMSSLSVNYVVVRGSKESQPGKATINFAAVGPTKIQRDLTFVTADRTKAFSFALQGATLSNQAGDGTWGAAAANVTFTPNQTLAATEVTVTAAYQTATEQGTLSLTYLPVPKVIAKPGIDRTAVTTVDIKAENSITAPFVLKLWNGAQAVDTFSLGGLGTWSAMGTSISWSGAGAVVVATSVGVGYVLIAADKTLTAQGGVQITFDAKPVAYPFTVTLPNPLPSDGKVRIKMLEHCFPAVPKGFEIPANAGISWNRDPADNNGTAVIDLPAQRPASGLFTFPYTVKDQSDTLSVEAVITIRYPAFTRRFMPMAADCLLSKTSLNGHQVAADVLAGSSSFFDKDPKSVRLTGLKDIGQGNQATQALLAKDGKSIRVPGEGVWVVGDSGLIGFTAEPRLSIPPTPVAFQFADVKGNLSNEAMVVIDPAMDALTAFPANLAAMDDAAFWKSFQLHVSRARPPLSDEVFLTAISTLAGAVRAGAAVQGGVGLNPVARADFAKTLQDWVDNGQSWDDPVGTAHPTGLVGLVADLVDPLMANSTLPLSRRYWRLRVMVEMIAGTMDDLT